MSANKTTPLPWRSEEVADTGGEDCLPICEILSGDGASRLSLVAEHVHGPDAELIVRAVNCHAELLAALRVAEERLGRLLKVLGPDRVEWADDLATVRAAIAKAEGRS